MCEKHPVFSKCTETVEVSEVRGIIAHEDSFAIRDSQHQMNNGISVTPNYQRASKDDGSRSH
jgi:hypothetical protein